MLSFNSDCCRGDGCPLLSVKDVSFVTSQKVPVVRRVSKNVLAGRLVMAIGAEGAGKSALLSLMAGQARSSEGDVRLGEKSLRRIGRQKLARQLAWVPIDSQECGLFGHMSVYEMVAIGRLAHSQTPKGLLDDILTSWQLDMLADATYASLTDSQRCRVRCARAEAQLSGEGRVLLLDEPEYHLDLAATHGLMTHLLDLARRGLAVVVAVRDPALVSHFADEVWLMRGGRILADGRPDDVLTSARLTEAFAMPMEVCEVNGRHYFQVSN